MAKKTPTKPLNPRPGQPTKYRPEFCQKLIEHCAKGFSFESFGWTIGVSRDAVFEWAKIHPEFSDAKSMALDANLYWFETQGQKGMWVDKEGPALNNPIWSISMKNRHGWRDNKNIEMRAKITDESEAAREKIRKMPTAELKKLVKSNILEEDE